MFRPSFKSLQAGFTLAEMVTVVAIIIIMTAVVLANFPEFRDRASLELVAQEISLVIRQAQSFGANTRGVFSNPVLFPSYGVYFNLANGGFSPPGSLTSFALFADRDGNGGYLQAGGCNDIANTECREVFRLEGGLKLDQIQTCFVPASGAPNCAVTDPLIILFQRPNPEANFRNGTPGSGGVVTCAGGGCSYAKIVLRSLRNNATRDICVWSTGHIYTKASSGSC